MNTVLVVDDSAMDRRRAGGLIEKGEDWAAVYAEDGNSALAQIDSEAPDVVVADLTMPGMDGLELVSAVRQKHPHLPVVIMTSRRSEDTAVEALRRGAASYVPKRRLATDLLSTIRSVVSASREVQHHAQLKNHLIQQSLSFVLPPELPVVLALAGHVQQ